MTSMTVRQVARRSTTCAVAGLICVGAAAAAQTRDTERGAALLADARSALGGEERLRAVTALDVRGDFKRMVGQTTIEGEVQIRLERPDKLRRDEDLSLPGGGPAIVRTEVLNGSTVWDENRGRGGLFLGRFGGDARGRGGAAIDPAQLEEAQRRARQTELARLLLIWLLEADNPAWIGTAEAPDGKADVLEITPAVGPVMRLFLDATSHIPLMLTWQGTAPQLRIAGRRGARGGEAAQPQADRPREATFRMTFEDYKAVNGIRLPHLVTRGVDGTTIEEWTIDAYRVNPSFGAGVFTR